jgi:caffeoyl-CoA O-methyltransferase
MSGTMLHMTDELYSYLDSVSDREPAVLRELREETQRDPRFNMAVAPLEGQFLGVLVRMIGARKICEVGVYTGYSSLSMALAMPADGRMWCFDVSETWTAIARKYWQKAGVHEKITLRLAPGEESMRGLLDEGHAGTFDLVFIDADKPNYPKYWDFAHALLRRGGLALADNTMFQEVVLPRITDDDLRRKWSSRPPAVQQELIDYTHAIRAFNRKVHKDERFAISMIPVGDGMTFGVKL